MPRDRAYYALALRGVLPSPLCLAAVGVQHNCTPPPPSAPPQHLHHSGLSGMSVCELCRLLTSTYMHVCLCLQGLLAASSLPVQPAAVLAASALQQPLAGAASSTQQQVDGASTAAATQAGEGEGVLPGDPDPAADAMIDWLHRNGGEVRLRVGCNNSQAGRCWKDQPSFTGG